MVPVLYLYRPTGAQWVIVQYIIDYLCFPESFLSAILGWIKMGAQAIKIKKLKKNPHGDYTGAPVRQVSITEQLHQQSLNIVIVHSILLFLNHGSKEVTALVYQGNCPGALRCMF